MSYLLIDAKNLLWRSESAMPTLQANGFPTGGIHGSLNALVRVVEEYHPSKLVVCWDDWESGPKARRTVSVTYKARDVKPDPRRDEAAKRVRQQMTAIIDFFAAMDVKQARSPEWEADDVMGTLAKRYASKGKKVLVLTGDRDLLQCVTDSVTVLRPQSDGSFKEETPESVKEGFGVTVEQFIDYKAIVGDSSDGYAGCPGIGEKGAVALLGVFGSVEKVLNAAKRNDLWKAQGLKERMAGLLTQHEAAVLTCQKLATINVDAPLVFVKRKRDFRAAMGMLNKWQLKVMLSQFSKLKSLAWRGA